MNLLLPEGATSHLTCDWNTSECVLFLSSSECRSSAQFTIGRHGGKRTVLHKLANVNNVSVAVWRASVHVKRVTSEWSLQANFTTLGAFMRRKIQIHFHLVLTSILTKWMEESSENWKSERSFQKNLNLYTFTQKHFLNNSLCVRLWQFKPIMRR